MTFLLTVILLFTSCASTAGSSAQEESSFETSEVQEAISQSEPENNSPQNTERIPNIVAVNKEDPYVRLLRDPNEWTPEDFIFLLNIPRIEHYGIWGFQNPETYGYTWGDGEFSGVFSRIYGRYESFANVFFDDPMRDSTHFYDKPLMAEFSMNKLLFCDFEGRVPLARDLFRDFGVGEVKVEILNNTSYTRGVAPPNYSYWLFYTRDGLMYAFELRVRDDFTDLLTFEEIMDLEVFRVFILLEDNPLIDRDGNINPRMSVGSRSSFEK